MHNYYDSARGAAHLPGAMMKRASPTLEALLHYGTEEFRELEIAAVNLTCAAGLPGGESINIPECLQTLAHWTAGVKRYTDDAVAEFQRHPEQYGRHEGVFRFLSLVTFLKHPRGLALKYQPTAINNFEFHDSRDDLIHGLLTRRLGTCTSFPVLFVAIGRRLGYPMHLAIAKCHVLCQWTNPDGSHINLEGSTAGGGETPPDEHYHHWPPPLSSTDLASGRYLLPLTRAEEFGLFLETRGHCLADNGRFDEARQAYHDAHRISDGWSRLDGHLSALDELAAGRR